MIHKSTYLFLIAMAAAPWALAKDDFISGRVVNGEGAPEAGVWVIAETADLPTDYRKIVVTNDEGKFVLPQLPDASYQLWVRGYGLVDSKKIKANLGDDVALLARTAASSQEAAAIYPASYWLSMVKPPAADVVSELDYAYSQETWLAQFKLNCIVCHQLGSVVTRSIPGREHYETGLKKAEIMPQIASELDWDVTLDVMGDFGERVVKGETPSVQPSRPQGIERNIVITQWGWGDLYTYAHDEISTDKRNPYLYPDGPVYGIDMANDRVLWVDPVKNSAHEVKMPMEEWGWTTPWGENTYVPLGGGEPTLFGSRSLGSPAPGGATIHEGKYNNPANIHNHMLDAEGKLWLTIQIRREWGEDLPEFCKKSEFITSYGHHRQLGYLDTKTGDIVPVDTCFGTHHLQFDNNDVLWTSGDPKAMGRFDTKVFNPDEPGSLQAAQSWVESKVDSDGDGKADLAITGFHYGVQPSYTDNSVWTSIPPGMLWSEPNRPGHLLRYDGVTKKVEAFKPPAPGYGPRGLDVDSKGVVWTALAGSNHLARFDYSQCKQTWGAGDQCPEGWTLWKTPTPYFNLDSGASVGTDMHYYTWVDRFNTLGLGKDTVIFNGTNSDSLIAFNPVTEDFTVIRIPYPLNTYTRGMDGRIDDENGGWKGRGLWFTNGIDPMVHTENRKGYAGKVQVRPDPLAH
ncbi:MAG: hypothetical protein M0Q95_15620 [Porticoccaceae bacterium]|nr:hypothetical protein [Porticoccaceae bacterium]